ncbi:hypothetical protein EYF80_040216 [Liparis tanakae]|uniref:Uncharacterized protein n=1 Tax=Liparis tanakae TaxID=230148 RepID=A0A4Z2G7S9_9TELE|nr:hypothetical protein EYF80_040216 [Liparis tanakae]
MPLSVPGGGIHLPILPTSSRQMDLHTSLTYSTDPEPETEKPCAQPKQSYRPASRAWNISASHVHIWTWNDRCEKNGLALD